LKYRLATLRDSGALLLLFSEYYDEWPNPDTPWEPEAVAASISRLVLEEGIVVVENKGEIVGAAVFESVSPYWSSSLILECRILYVQKPYRGKSVAVRLLKEVDKVGKQRGCVSVHVGTTSGIETERTSQWYERLGFNKLGYEYRKEVGS